MSTIAAFTDLISLSRGVAASAIDKVQSEATSYRRYLTRLMMTGIAKERMIQGGPTIQDYIQLAFTNSYREYGPNDEFEWTSTNSASLISLPWKYAMVHMVWHDHEVMLSSGDLTTTFKRVKDFKMSEMELSFFEGREKSLWATPDVVTMEGGTTTGSAWHSLRCYITEDGGAPSSTNGGVTGSDWTTVLGQNPSTIGQNWKNQVENYNPAKIDIQLPRAMDLMWDDVQYESPSDSQQYVTDTAIQKTTILTNRDGYAILMDLTRNKNDRLFTKENDFGMLNGALTYHGLAIRRIGAMDDSAVFGSSNLYAAGSPRYWFVNFNHIYPIFHRERFLHPLDIPIPVTKPQAHIVPKDTWGELWCNSRRQQGIVVPSSSV
jgi:hypothetical protein